MDTTQALFDWLDNTPDLKNFDVPLMSDKDASIARQFGVLQQAAGQDHTGAGFPANSVFIIDNKDMVRYHCVLDSRVAFNIGEIARLVRAFQASDKSKGLAMADFNNKEQIVTNKIPNIKHYYGTKFGGEKHACEGCPKEDSSVKPKPSSDGDKKPLICEAHEDKEEEKTENKGFFSMMKKMITKIWSTGKRLITGHYCDC